MHFQFWVATIFLSIYLTTTVGRKKGREKNLAKKVGKIDLNVKYIREKIDDVLEILDKDDDSVAGPVIFHIQITNELDKEVSGTISFENNNPLPEPYTVIANSAVKKDFLPLEPVIVNITAKTDDGISCEPYILTEGEPKLKFHIVSTDNGGCIVLPASQQYHPIGITEWEENGITVTQEDYFHPVTKEAILKTPAHGNNFATTMIFQSSKKRSGEGGLMVTAAGDECTINVLPAELGIDPEHMVVEQNTTNRSFFKRKTRTDDSKSYFVLRHATNTYVNPSNNTLYLTETMKEACENKTIFYNNEHIVVNASDYTNNTIQELTFEDTQRFKKSLGKISRDYAASERQGFKYCQNIKYKFSNEATRNCGTWRYTGIQDTTDAGHVKPPSYSLFNHVRSAWQIVVECCGDDGTITFPCSQIPNGASDAGEQAFATAFYRTWSSRHYGCPGKSKFCQWDENSNKYENLNLYPKYGACVEECQDFCARPNSCPKCYGWIRGFYPCVGYNGK